MRREAATWAWGVGVEMSAGMGGVCSQRPASKGSMGVRGGVLAFTTLSAANAVNSDKIRFLSA